MPPKIKTETEDVTKAAFEIARRQGMEAVTAKSVAQQLGTSVGPIFRAFENMEELKRVVTLSIGDALIAHLKSYPFTKSEFMTYGLAYINFAAEEPKLFEILMSSGFFELDSVEEIVSKELDFVVRSASTVGEISKDQGKRLFFDMWIYTHGIATMVGMGDLKISQQEVKKLLERVFYSFLPQERS